MLDKLEHETAYVPAIWPLELTNILITAERRKRITYAKITQFLELLNGLNIHIDNETANRAFHETFILAHAEGLTSYDASYLELAMRLGVPLATKDQQLAKVAAHLGAQVLTS